MTHYEKLSKLKFSDKISLRLDDIETRLSKIEKIISELFDRIEASDGLNNLHSDGLTRLNQEIITLKAITTEVIREGSWAEDNLKDKKRLLYQYKKNLNSLKIEIAKVGFNLPLRNQIEDTEQRIAELELEIKTIVS